MKEFLYLICSYLLGSIPTGFLIGKWKAGIDIREYGSGSTGATNVLRHLGKWPALIVFLVDVGKGVSSVLICKAIFSNDLLHVLAGLSALSGHIWPVWLRGKGGKAVATGLGMFLGLSWPVGLGAFGIFLLIFSISKIVSLSSLIAAISLPILMTLNFESHLKMAYISVSFAATGLVIWRHRNNIRRLLQGKEPQIGQSK